MHDGEFKIVPMTAEDWPAVESIYREAIDTGLATLETKTPTFEDWDRRHLIGCRLTARIDGDVVAWAALLPVSSREPYRGVAEVSIYVGAAAQGQGLGKRLLARLVEESEAHGFWTLQAGIFPENAASLALHRGCGFRDVGVRERIARREGVWRDVVLLERRSSAVGNDGTAAC